MGTLIFSVSGLRGIVGDGLNPETISRYTAAFSQCLKSGPIIVGRDPRPSGPVVQQIVMATLAACGRRVLDAGMVPTPTVQYAVRKQRAAGGIVVSASHNPTAWNALKFMGSKGHCLGPNDVAAMGDKLTTAMDGCVSAHRLGSIRHYETALAAHRDAVLAHPLVERAKVRRKKFSVVLDAVNGAGAVLIPEILQALGCRVHVLHGEPSGRFERGPEPVAKNLRKLCRAVRDRKADIGFALDPDGDRLAVVDEQGHPIGEDLTLACVADYVLQHCKGPVVTNLSTSLALDGAARRHGAVVVRTPVGEINVVEEMLRRRCTLAGEGNGGVIIRDLAPGRDAAIGVALFLRWLADERGPLSERLLVLPKYVMLKGKLPGNDAVYRQLLKSADRLWPKAEKDSRDGVRYAGEDWWVHIRRSNTEPIIRVIAEAPTRKQTQAFLQSLHNNIQVG
jgi:phosphomannomutase